MKARHGERTNDDFNPSRRKFLKALGIGTVSTLALSIGLVHAHHIPFVPPEIIFEDKDIRKIREQYFPAIRIYVDTMGRAIAINHNNERIAGPDIDHAKVIQEVIQTIESGYIVCMSDLVLKSPIELKSGIILTSPFPLAGLSFELPLVKLDFTQAPDNVSCIYTPDTDGTYYVRGVVIAGFYIVCKNTQTAIKFGKWTRQSFIIGNCIRGAKTGIELGPNSDMLNIIAFNDIREIAGYGIHVRTGSNQVRILYNWIHYCALDGIRVEWLANVDIIGNVIEYNEGYGLILQDIYGAYVAGNYFEHNKYYQINVVNVNLSENRGITILGNYMIGKQYTGYPMRLKNVIGGLISGNVCIDHLTSNAPYLEGTIDIEWGQNYGFKAKKSGVATILAGSTSVTVNHGLFKAPSKVIITPLAQPPGKLWIENITDTSFDIVTDTAPAIDLPVVWIAEV